MPRVLRIINRLNLGGPTFNAAYLSKYLHPEFETLLVAGMIDDTEASSEFITHEMGLHPVYIPEMHRNIDLFKDRKAYLKIKNLIREFKPDIVHTHAAKAGTLGRLAASACGVPVVLHTFHGHVFHSYFSKWKTRLYIEMERYAGKKSTRIITLSEKLKHELSEVYKIVPAEKIEVVPLGFDLKKFSEKQTEKRQKFRKHFLLDDDEIAIAIVGRLVPVKNHAMFIRALDHLLHNSSKRVRAFVVGDGEERSNIEAFAQSLGINFTDFTKRQERAPLTFTSWIKEVDEVCAGSDIVTLSSFNEGTPVSLIEAQVASKPIVTTDVGGIRDIVAAGVSSIIVSSNDQEAFNNALLLLVNDDQERRRMTGYDSKAIEEKFSFTRLVNDMASLYRRLLHNT